MEIKKIVIQGSSGYGTADQAYVEKLTLTDETISYEYRPFIQSEISHCKKWTYKTNNPKFLCLFRLVAAHMSEIIQNPPADLANDVGGIEFTVTYEDKTKWKQLFWMSGDSFKNLFSVIKKMVPQGEDEPEVLRTSYDDRNSL